MALIGGTRSTTMPYDTYLFSAKPSAAGKAGSVIYLSDVGEGGTLWISDGTKWQPLNNPYALAFLDAPITTNDSATESVIYQKLIQANRLKAGDIIEIDYFAYRSNTTDQHFTGFRFGTLGTTADSIILSQGDLTSTALSCRSNIIFKVESSTVITMASRRDSVSFGVSSYALSTATVNLAVNNYFSITSKKAVGGTTTATFGNIAIKHTSVGA